MGPRLQGDDGSDEVARLQHDPPPLLRSALRCGEHAQQHRLQQEPRSAGTEWPADHGQDRGLRRPDRTQGLPRPPPLRGRQQRQCLWSVVYLRVSREQVDQQPVHAGHPLRGQLNRHRHRPPQRTARSRHLGRRECQRLATGSGAGGQRRACRQSQSADHRGGGRECRLGQLLVGRQPVERRHSASAAQHRIPARLLSPRLPGKRLRPDLLQRFHLSQQPPGGVGQELGVSVPYRHRACHPG